MARSRRSRGPSPETIGSQILLPPSAVLPHASNPSIGAIGATIAGSAEASSAGNIPRRLSASTSMPFSIPRGTGSARATAAILNTVNGSSCALAAPIVKARVPAAPLPSASTLHTSSDQKPLVSAASRLALAATGIGAPSNCPASSFLYIVISQVFEASAYVIALFRRIAWGIIKGVFCEAFQRFSGAVIEGASVSPFSPMTAFVILWASPF